MEKLSELYTLLETPLDTDNPVALMQQLAECEAWQATVSQRYRNKQTELAHERDRNYPAKDKDLFSNAEARLYYMESATATIQAETDKLKDLAQIIQTRISLGQSMLAGHRVEAKSGLRVA